MPQLPGGPLFPQQDPLHNIGGLPHDGAVPMSMARGIELQYPNLRVQGDTDWHHVNPRLLKVLDSAAKKQGGVIVVSDGYRSNTFNDGTGGHPQSTHKRGIAIHAFMNGHPIGEVMSPEELAKLGLGVGGPNGDLSHIDLKGIPMKQQAASLPTQDIFQAALQGMGNGGGQA